MQLGVKIVLIPPQHHVSYCFVKIRTTKKIRKKCRKSYFPEYVDKTLHSDQVFIDDYPGWGVDFSLGTLWS